MDCHSKVGIELKMVAVAALGSPLEVSCGVQSGYMSLVPVC